MNTLKERIKLWLEWQDALLWAEVLHPGMAYLATQDKRPELRDIYRTKIIEAYRSELEHN